MKTYLEVVNSIIKTRSTEVASETGASLTSEAIKIAAYVAVKNLNNINFEMKHIKVW